MSPSLPDNGGYASATWSGISGDRFYLNGEGADGAQVTNKWLDTHIRKGPLGRHYPKFEFIMEGDTPAFLGLTRNGLASAQSPAWGGWGGRYVYRRAYGESRAIWTQGGSLLYGADSRDAVRAWTAKFTEATRQTIWRWRNAFQNDFAARMDWTVAPPTGQTIILGHREWAKRDAAYFDRSRGGEPIARCFGKPRPRCWPTAKI